MKKIMNGLENFAKVMIQPLMYLSVAGIVMVLGVLLTNNFLKGVLPFLNWFPIQLLGNLIYNCVMVIINNLNIIFAIGIAAAIAKKDKHQAAIIAFMSYLMYLTTSNTVLQMTGNLATPNEMLGLIGTGQSLILGIQNVDMSVFGGIILGFLTGWVFNKTSHKRFKGAMEIYSGVRFTFFVMIFVSMVFGVVSTYLWPYVQTVISTLAMLIKNTGDFGLFMYGFLERLLIPTGLHHLIYTPFQFSDLGGVLQLGDKTIVGAYAIVMAEMNMPVAQFSDSIYYMAIGFTKMFGYIGIGAAFIHTARKENKAKTRAIIIPLIITACLASVTEPLDFMFAFAAPILFVIHAIIAGVFIVLLSVFNVTAFCGGNLIASVLMNVMAGPAKTNYPVMFILGIVQILVYYFLFSFLIKKFNMRTPGREIAVEIDAANNVKPISNDESKENSEIDVVSLVDGLGGKDNIQELENCFTRLRVRLKDPSLLNDTLVNTTKNSGIVKKDNDIQIIYGLQVPEIKKAVEEYLEKE